MRESFPDGFTLKDQCRSFGREVLVIRDSQDLVLENRAPESNDSLLPSKKGLVRGKVLFQHEVTEVTLALNNQHKPSLQFLLSNR